MSNNRKYWFHCAAMQFFYCSIAVAGNDDHIEKKYAWKYNHKNGSTMVNTGSIARQCYFLLFNCRCWHWRAVIDSKSNLTEEKLHCKQWDQCFPLLTCFYDCIFMHILFWYGHHYQHQQLMRRKFALPSNGTSIFCCWPVLYVQTFFFNFNCKYFIFSWLNATLLWQPYKNITFNWATIGHIVHE